VTELAPEGAWPGDLKKKKLDKHWAVAKPRKQLRLVHVYRINYHTRQNGLAVR
jgi:hypothetical protein